MFSVLQLMGKVAFFPIWLLWKGYLFLWWAFDDAKPKVGAQTPSNTQAGTHAEGVNGGGAAAGVVGGQDAAFQVVDSRPKAIERAIPIGALKGGFLGTMMASIGVFLGMQAAAGANVLNPSVVMPLWLWTTGVVSVASIFAVRRVVRKREQRKRRMVERARQLANAAGNLAVGASRFAVNRVAPACVRAGKRAGHAAVGAARHVSETIGRSKADDRIAGGPAVGVDALADGSEKHTEDGCSHWGARLKRVWGDLADPVKAKRRTSPVT